VSAVLSNLVIAIGLLILGALVSLLALLPPIRRWCRRNRPARAVTLCALCLASFAPSFLLWTRLAAEVSVLYSALVTVDTFDRPPVVVATGPDAGQPLVIRELWHRRLVLPSLRRACYARDEAICRQADAIAANVPGMWSGRAYLEEVGMALVPALSAGVLGWLWTRTRQSSAPAT
jgi:hypothetical protein